jgi:hypothetical protein
MPPAPQRLPSRRARDSSSRTARAPTIIAARGLSGVWPDLGRLSEIRPKPGQARERNPIVVDALQLSRVLGGGSKPAGVPSAPLAPVVSGEEMAEASEPSQAPDIRASPSPMCRSFCHPVLPRASPSPMCRSFWSPRCPPQVASAHTSSVLSDPRVSVTRTNRAGCTRRTHTCDTSTPLSPRSSCSSQWSMVRTSEPYA